MSERYLRILDNFLLIYNMLLLWLEGVLHLISIPLGFFLNRRSLSDLLVLCC